MRGVSLRNLGNIYTVKQQDWYETVAIASVFLN